MLYISSLNVNNTLHCQIDANGLYITTAFTTHISVVKLTLLPKAFSQLTCEFMSQDSGGRLVEIFSGCTCML